MNPIFQMLLGPVFDTINKVIDRAWPDPVEAAKMKIQLLQMQQAGDLKELDASVAIAVEQIKTNQAEASSGSAYAAGWRPTVGYIGCISLAWNFVGFPVANYVMAAMKLGVTPPPMLDLGPLLTILMGMLGIGTLRTIEKIKGVNS